MKYVFNFSLLLLSLFAAKVVAAQAEGAGIERTWTADLQFCSVQPFGPSSGGGELSADGHPLTYDGRYHWKVGFKNSRMLRLGVSRCVADWRIKASVGYMVYRIGMEDQFFGVEYPFGKMEALDFQLSALARLSGKRNQPGGMHTGFFLRSTSGLSSQIYRDSEILFGASEPEARQAFHWGCEFEYLWTTGLTGPYFGFNAMVTMPGMWGELGTLKLKEESSYLIEEDRIRAYVFGFGITAGCAF